MKSKKGDFYAQAALEDMAGTVDMIVFPEAYRRLQEKVKLEVPVLVQSRGARGRRRESQAHGADISRSKTPRFRCRARCASASRSKAATETTVDALHLLFTERKGEAKVLFDVEREGDFMVVMEAEGYNVQPDRNFIARVEELCGRGGVRVIN